MPKYLCKINLVATGMIQATNPNQAVQDFEASVVDMLEQKFVHVSDTELISVDTVPEDIIIKGEE